ncbi:MAG: hypothetical protein GXO79_09655 [Chlorobi bacterium]|nr:hypothetical protein [Chlorobiota bacterium]
MDLINELAYILSKKKSARFDSYLPANSKIRKLYDLVTQKEVLSDDVAAHEIYNTGKADKKYLMLKRNLIQKLSELVFMEDYVVPYEENYVNIQFRVERELNIAEKLILENVYHNPTKIIAKVEHMAEKYYLIDVQVSAAKKFRSVYALKGFPAETEKYDNKVKQLTKYQQYYNEAKGMWEVLYSKTKYTIAKIPEFIFEAYHYSEIIKQWLHEYDSPFMRLYFYKISSIKYDQQNDNQKFFETINSLNKLTQDYHFVKSQQLLLEINYAYALYYRNIRKVDIAEEYLHKCLELSDYRAFNKFQVQQLLFEVKIKQKKYTDAGEILYETFCVPQFELLDNYDKSAWAIREAYLYFIFKAHNYSELFKYLPNIDSSFELNSFLERTKKSSKDKFGYNIVLLIIRLLFMAKSNFSEIDNEGNNLLIYYHRYLKELNSYRTREFFKAVSKMGAKGFEKEIIEERKEILKSRLEKSEENVYDVFELIPYLDFLNMIPEFLSKEIKK